MQAYLAQEVAFDGETGVSFARFKQFVAAYHDEHTSEGAHPQLVDDSYVDYAWKNLVQARQDIRVGYVKPREASTVPDLGPDDPEDGPLVGKHKPKSLKGRGRVTLLGSGRQKDSDVEFIELDEQQRHASRCDLSAKYGKDLRLAASPETCWVALTGSHDRPSRLTGFVYAVLESIARRREDGITMVELGHEFVHDQKSCFHFVKALTDQDIVVKIRGNYYDAKKQGNIHTSRMIHRRFLAQSKYWRMSAEAAAAEKQVEEGKEETMDERPTASSSTDPSTWQPLTKEHFYTNSAVVINRLKYVLRRAEGHMLPHTDVIHAIKLTEIDVQHRKKLNRVIDKLVKDGELEKVLAPSADSGKDSSIHCIRLVVNEDEPDLSKNEQIEMGALNAGVGMRNDVTLEWQVAELLHNAGAKGMSLRDFGEVLSLVDLRIIESILNKLEHQAPPPHLSDYAFCSTLETSGRLKQTRFFTYAGYKARCEQDGIDAPAPKYPIDAEAAGGFGPTSSRFYSSIDELDQTVDSFASVMTKKGSKGKTKLSRADPTASSQPEKPAAAPAIPRKRGRPKKLPGAPKAPYVKKKDKLAAAKKAKVDTNELDAEEDERPAKRRRVEAEPDIAVPPDDSVRIDVDDDELGEDLTIAVAPKRKRGRPRKIPLPVESDDEPPSPAAKRSRDSIAVDQNIVVSMDVDADETGEVDEDRASLELERESVPASPALSIKAARPSKAPRIPHTQAVREAELIALIKSKGGIALDWHPLRAEHLEYIRETKGEEFATANPMDKLTMERVVKSMVSRNVMKREMVTQPTFSGNKQRYKILFLPDIEFDSDQMRTFLASLQQKTIAPDAASWKDARTKTDEQVQRKVPIRAKKVVQEQDTVNDEEIRAKLATQWRVVAQWHGYVYGSLARARLLHLWIVDYLNAAKQDMLSVKELFTEMPISLFAQIVPLSIDEEDLNSYLDDADNLSTLLGDLPDEIRRTLSIGKTKSRERMLNVLSDLCDLSLLAPLDESGADETGEHQMVATEPIQASHFRLQKQMPVYMLAQKSSPKPLVKVVALTDAASSQSYWDSLRKATSRVARDNPSVEGIEAPDGLLKSFPGSDKFCSECCTPARWETAQVLLPDQIAWLNRQAGEDPKALLDDEQQMTMLSEALLAKRETIAKHLEGLAAAAARPVKARRKSKAAAEGPDKKPRASKGKVKEKAVDATEEPQVDQAEDQAVDEQSEEREREWKQILGTYEQRAGRLLDHDTAQIFRGMFLSDGANRITARQLESHLSRFFGYRDQTITLPDIDVPSAAPSKAKGKAKKSAAPVEAPQQERSASPEAAPPPSKAAKPKASGSKGAKAAIEEQQEGQNAAPQSSQQRMRWSAASNDILRDAYAIAHARAQHLGVSLAWEVVARVLPERATVQVRQHCRLLLNRASESDYLRSLEAAWTTIWLRDRRTGALDDGDGKSATDFDMEAHLEHLRRHVDKSDLRPAEQSIAVDEEVDLPADIDDIATRWVVKRSGDKALRADEVAISNWWQGGGATTKDRADALTRLPFSIARKPATVSVDVETTAEASLAAMVVKMSLSTPHLALDASQKKAVFESIDAEAVLEELSNRGVVKQARKGKRYEYSEKYSQLLDDAPNADVEPAANEGEEVVPWPLLLDEGSMMQLCQDFQTCQVGLEIDMSLVSEALGELGFNARKGDDETIETSLSVRRLSRAPPLVERLLPPSEYRGVLAQSNDGTHGLTVDGQPAVCAEELEKEGCTRRYADCKGCIDESTKQALLDLRPEVKARASMLIQYISASKACDAQTVQEQCDSLGIEDAPAIVDRLVNADPPVLFWAGHDRPALVSAIHLADWSVVVPVDDQRQRIRVFPRMWLDLDGAVVPDMWQSVSGYVLKALAESPAITETALLVKVGSLLERLELVDILDRLLDAGLVVVESSHAIDTATRRFWHSDQAHYSLAPDFRW